MTGRVPTANGKFARILLFSSHLSVFQEFTGWPGLRISLEKAKSCKAKSELAHHPTSTVYIEPILPMWSLP